MTLVDDGTGNQTETWTPLATLRAQLIEASTEEFIRSYGASSETATIFRTRYMAEVTLADRVSYNGQPHNLIEIKEIGRRRGLELRTKRLD
ncbi:phage head closure protein [Mesorhizobium sp. AA22]|uniref:phage head closure protein n=1 Tax=Mesorhizobium sp. AA22 TaxID=1854057 RepID=UPI001FEEDEF3|nr:phage head closure protein [Mesorhizobium sp. AA22]